MDVLVLSSIRPPSGPGVPGTASIPRVRRRRAWLAALFAQSGSGPSSGSDAVATRRNGLLVYTAASIVLGLGILAWSTANISVWSSLDPHLPGTTLAGADGGLLLWLMFGLLGSVRVLRTLDGAHITFHLPFIGAAMILGGPTAGAWVAFLSTIERRELESQPWYGILANHSVLAIAAVMGGLTTQVVAGVLGAGPMGTGGGAFTAALAGTLVLAAVSTAMGATTVMLRDGLTAHAFFETLVGQIGRVTAVEIALVLVLALGYAQVGWWTPVLVGAFVLAIWDNHPMPAPDALTGLQPAEGFTRRLEAGLGRMRRGLTPGSTLLSLDLNLFKTVNDRYGHAVGDEVLAEVGNRLRGQARRSNDIAGRLGGDELALFLPGLSDARTAMRRADEVAASICEPIATSVGAVTVGVSIGVLVVESWGGVPSTTAVLRQADQAMFHAKRAGGGVHRYDPDEPAPFDDSWIEGLR